MYYLNRWFTEYRCVECKKPINEIDKMYSDGRCPHCGFKHKNACTIVKTTEHAVKIVKKPIEPPPKFWEFWKPKYIEVKVYKEDIKENE